MNSRKFSRFLRKHQTETEDILWQELRNRKLAGYKFLRQHPIKVLLDGKNKIFYADFYCAEAKLVLEVDGPIHDRQVKYDVIREDLLRTNNYQILRIKNEEVEFNLDSTLKMIQAKLDEI